MAERCAFKLSNQWDVPVIIKHSFMLICWLYQTHTVTGTDKGDHTACAHTDISMTSHAGTGLLRSFKTVHI